MSETKEHFSLACFLGQNPKSELVFVIDQIDQQTGEFDEAKCLLGFNSKPEAVDAYQRSYDSGWKVGPIRAMHIDEFRDWVMTGRQSGAVKPQAGAGLPQASAEGILESFNESDHPRADDGKFISGDAITAAKLDSGKAADLLAKTTKPEERAKLEKELGKAPTKAMPPVKRSRKDMPQIAGVDKEDFYNSLRSQGVKVTPREIPASQIKSMQIDHNQDKVDAMADKIKAGEPVGTSRSIVSSDGYMMDGNHRMLAQQSVDPNGLLPVTQVDLTADELIGKMEGYGRSFKVGTDEGSAQRATSNEAARETMKRELETVNKEYPAANKSGGDTYNRFRNPDGSWTPERQKLHETIVSHAVADALPSENRTVFLMGGGSAAGKGTLLRKGLVKRSDSFAYIDADEIKGELPEYKAMSAGHHMGAAAFAHEESSHLANSIMDAAFKKGADVSLDGTGDSGIDKLAGKIQKMREAGYKVSANYVTVDTETAVARSQERGRKSGRFVPVAAIENIHAQVSRVVPEAIARGLYDDFKLWDNNEDTPRLVAEAKGTELKVHDQSLWDRFVSKAK